MMMPNALGEFCDMYRGFNLTVDFGFPSGSSEAGQTVFAANRQTVRQALAGFVRDGKIDGQKMSEHWFPKTEANVFISHSHRDEADAVKLAGWLKNNFGIDSFIDSCVWGYADDLLKKIDDVYCFNTSTKTYSYERRNGSTSHVHMMLSTALAAMIDATESVIFLNTPHSITSEDAVNKTLSPWLYYELGMMRLVRRRPAQEHRPQELLESFANKRAGLLVEYPAELTGLTAVGATHLKEWMRKREKASKNTHSLDLLYEAAPE